jgi:hypothetical protein
MQAVARDPGLFRDEARRFMNLIAAASRNRCSRFSWKRCTERRESQAAGGMRSSVDRRCDPEKFKTNYSKKFWEASEANAGKYDLDPETCGLKEVATGKIPSFYFGYPFPKIDPTEPLAACKMA